MNHIETLEVRRLLAATFDNLFIPDQSVYDSIELDFDHDGRMDIVAASDYSVTVHRNKGARAFETTAVMPYSSSGKFIEQLLKFDVDRDGVEDALAICSMDTTLEILKITSGGVQLYASVNLGANSGGATAGDFNQDGYLDLVASYTYGIFSSQTKYWVGGPSVPLTLYSSVADISSRYKAIDVEGDGDLDLYSSYHWRENLGGNQFAPASVTPMYGLGSYIVGTPALADLDGDGDFDYAIPYGPSGSTKMEKLDIYTRTGSGLALSQSKNISTFARHMLAQDLDEDGDAELLLGGIVYRNDGNMQFEFDRYLVSANSRYQPRVADIDADGKIDLAIGVSGGFAVVWGGTHRLDAGYTDLYGPEFHRSRTLDYNGDGFDDMIGLFSSASSNIIRFANSNGGYRSISLTGSPSVNYYMSFGTGDFNADGKDDLAIAARMAAGTSSLLIYHSNGTSFVFKQQMAFSISSNDIGVGDFDADGDADLAIIASQLQVLDNDGSGAFSPGAQYSPVASGDEILTGDFDGNGRDDLAMVGGLRITVGLNFSGTGLTFGPPILFNETIRDADVLPRAGFQQDDIVVGTVTKLSLLSFGLTQNWSVSQLTPIGVGCLMVRDLDQDKRPEIVIGLYATPAVAILQGDAAAGFSSTMHPIHSTASVLHTTDFDRDGDIDIVAWSPSGNNETSYVSVVHNQTFEDTTVPELTVTISYDNPTNIVAVFQFNEDISRFLSVSDVVVKHAVTGQTVSLPAGMVSNGSFSLGLNIRRQNLVEGRYELSVLAGRITDSSGNPVAPQTVQIFNLLGDVDHDGEVGSSDILILAQNYGQTARTYSQGNINFSVGGLVDFADLLVLAQKYGTSVNVQTRDAVKKKRGTGFIALWP